MPANSSRKYVTRVDYIADFVGADVPRNLVKIAIADFAKPIETKDQQIPVPIEQDTDGAVFIVLKEDNVGLAKGSDIESLKGSQKKDFTTLEADVESAVAELTSLDDKVDVNLSVLAKLQRWRRNIEPEWVHADEVTAPAADTKLVSKTVSSGKSGYIYGFFIMAGEANDFKINWTSGGETKSIRIPFSSGGALQYVDVTPLNEGLPADEGTEISITNVNAGGSGVIYQARLLIAEV